MAALTTNDWWVENAPPPPTLADVTQRGGLRVPTPDPVSGKYPYADDVTVVGEGWPTIPNTTPGQPGLGGAPYGAASIPPVTGVPASGNYQQIFQQLTGGAPPTPQQLEALGPQLQQHGIEVLKNAWGVAGKIRLPNGQIVDVIAGAMQGGQNWQWLPDQGGALGMGGQNRSLYAPYAGTFTGGGQYPLASVMGPGFMQPWTTPFQAPNAVKQQNDPGWQFRMREGLNAIEKSAAAKGTLLTGGTLKALNSWAQDYASNEFDKVYGRALGEYQQAYGIYNQNLNNQWGRLGTLADRACQLRPHWRTWRRATGRTSRTCTGAVRCARDRTGAVGEYLGGIPGRTSSTKRHRWSVRHGRSRSRPSHRRPSSPTSISRSHQSPPSIRMGGRGRRCLTTFPPAITRWRT